MKLFQILFLFTRLLTLALHAKESRLNIIFLLTDDQSFYSLGCYGNPDVMTPNLDQLAKDGMTFDNHYNTTAICMASRANIMTGKLEYKSGCNFDHGPMTRPIWEKSGSVRISQRPKSSF